MSMAAHQLRIGPLHFGAVGFKILSIELPVLKIVQNYSTSKDSRRKFITESWIEEDN
jgi:hypothetical protein